MRGKHPQGEQYAGVTYCISTALLLRLNIDEAQLAALFRGLHHNPTIHHWADNIVDSLIYAHDVNLLTVDN